METPTLRGRHVVLEPLRVEHAKELAAAIGPEDDVWEWLYFSPRSAPEMEDWIGTRLAQKPGLGNLAFAQRDARTGAAMGSTSLFDIDASAHSAEIGFTWLAKPYRRSGANTEAKLLLLTYAFETLRLQRVQLTTDERNARSRAAIERIGGRFEGVLRRFRRAREGGLRNSAMYSFIDAEWPAAKVALQARLR